MIGLMIAACGHAPAPAPMAVAAPKKVRLAILPAESDAFPSTAKAVTDSLLAAKVAGIDETQISKASLEVVQLSIECVDWTSACYEAAGHSLAANQLLFAQITAEPNKHLKVMVTLFDVDGESTKSTQEKIFASDSEATAGVADLVAQATK